MSKMLVITNIQGKKGRIFDDSKVIVLLKTSNKQEQLLVDI